MTARALEENGIATVVIGSAIDIVTHCGVPRYLHNDIPLGNPLGHPYESDQHLDCVARALMMVRDESEPTVKKSHLKWQNGEAWRDNYMRVDDSNREKLKMMGEENRRRRREMIDNGEKRI